MPTGVKEIQYAPVKDIDFVDKKGSAAIRQSPLSGFVLLVTSRVVSSNLSPREWFHLTCLQLNSLPTSDYWYYPDCRKLSQFKKKRKTT